jgi:hypothetical protein
MRKILFISVTLGILLCLCGCSKTSREDNGSPKTVFQTKFDNPEDLNLWSQSAGGVAYINDSSVKFDSITSCFRFETINLIPAQAGKTYELRLTAKVNRSVSGDPSYCVGYFMIHVIQGNEKLISDGFGDYPTWTKKSYSFSTTSGAYLKIYFLIGTTRGAWIDELELIEH